MNGVVDVVPCKKIQYDPLEGSTVCCGDGVDLRKEVDAFKAHIQGKGWGDHVVIGRFDDHSNIFGFRVRNFVSREILIEIYRYFHEKGFPLDIYRTSIGMISTLREHIKDLKEYEETTTLKNL